MMVGMRREDEPRELSGALSDVLRSLEGGRRGAGASAPAVGGLFGRWAEIVGEAVARQVEPVRLDGDRLVVQVTEPAWATQVRLLSDRISARIAEVVGVTVTQLDVRVVAPRRR